MWMVVGGTGQLGQEIIKRLLHLNIKSISTNSKNFDLSNPKRIQEFIIKQQPKVVVNAAAFTNVDLAEKNRTEAWTINASGARNLAEAAKAVDATFVHFSTDYVFSGTSEIPFRENDLQNPINAYGHSKAAGEKAVLDVYPEQTYIFRTAWLYSARRTNFVKLIARKALAGEKVTVVDDQFGQPSFAGDVAERILEAVFMNVPKGIYHVTNNGVSSRFNFAKEIYRLAGSNTGLVLPRAFTHMPNLAERPKYVVLSHQRWEREGFQPMREWSSALKETMPSIISALETGD
jgi:dTDP-4-dehydrorhamnose reductase